VDFVGNLLLFSAVKEFLKSIEVVPISEPRCTAIILSMNMGPLSLLLVNVYMPDYGSLDCCEEYLDVRSKISVLYKESHAAFLAVMGDFNCSLSKRFYDIFKQFSIDNALICSDMPRLRNASVLPR